MPSRNLAVRAADWSTRHRRIAVLGWLALVLVAVGIGGAVGTKYIADEDLGAGEALKADQTLADAGFYDRAEEQVLVQDRDGRMTFSDPAFKSAVADVARTLERFGTTTDVKSPINPLNAGQVSMDR